MNKEAKQDENMDGEINLEKAGKDLCLQQTEEDN